MVEGETVQLTATVKPQNASDFTIVWSSSNPAVASVDEGLVAALKEGTTLITVSAGGKTASCSITVSAKYIPVSSITVYPTSVEMVEGDEITLTASIEPADATDKLLSWSSSDDNVASVYDGKVTARGVGIATITVKAGEKTATCDITVSKKVIHVESISLNLSQKRLKIGEQVSLIATVFPDNANDYTIVYSSSNPSIASVTNEGVVKGVSSGQTTVCAEAEGKKAEMAITVFEQDIIYAITTDWDYNSYTSKLWKNQDAIITAQYFTFEELYFINNQPYIIAHRNTSSEVEYYQIVNGDYRHFNPGTGATRNICQATALYNGDIYSIVEWDYHDSKSFTGV